MAIETALKFLERFEREDALRTQLYVSKPDSLEELTHFARGKGFVISEADLAQALEQYQERFPTGSVEPLKKYVAQARRLNRGVSDDSSSDLVDV
jgi:hypothetical protein